MKKLKFLFVSFLIVFISCERDDICSENTPTTPRLIIEFYDADNPDDLKSVSRLTAYGEGLVTDPTEASNTTVIFNSNSNSVNLPLRIGNDNETITSRFILERATNLRLNDNSNNTSNIDIIEVSYTSEFVYVSRACGYKSIFNTLNITEDATDTNPWISSIDVIESTVENENTVHVHIFH